MKFRGFLFEPVSSAIFLTAAIESIIGASAITIAGVTITAAAIGGAIISTAAVVGIQVVSGLLNKPPKSSLGTGQASVQDQTAVARIASRVAVASRNITIGRVLRAGSLFFEQVQGPYLYRGFILANHEIDGVDEVRLGTTVLGLDPTTGRANIKPYFDGISSYFLQVSIRTGKIDQDMDPILAVDFPTLDRSFRQRGLATAVIKLYRGSTSAVADIVWGQSDPNFLFLVRGHKWFDPRDSSQSATDTSTWKFTRNAAISTAGWLNDPDGGNVPWAFIDTDYLKVAADICDQSVSRLDGTAEPRYCIDGVADTSTDPNQLLSDLVLSMLGEYTSIAGKYAIFAGAKRDPVRTLTESSSRGTLDVVIERSWQDYLNSVSTSFVAKDRDYQVATGPVYNDLDAQVVDGTQKAATIQLPFVTSATQVQRICKYTIRRSQLGGALQRGENIEALRLVATDVVRLEYSGGLSSLSGNWELIRLTEADRLDEYVLQLAQYDGDFLFGWDPIVDERDWSQAPVLN